MSFLQTWQGSVLLSQKLSSLDPRYDNPVYGDDSKGTPPPQ